jgi:hypothetical protein
MIEYSKVANHIYEILAVKRPEKNILEIFSGGRISKCENCYSCTQAICVRIPLIAWRLRESRARAD